MQIPIQEKDVVLPTNPDPAQIPPESPSLRQCPELLPVPPCHQTSCTQTSPAPGQGFPHHQVPSPAWAPSSPPFLPYSRHPLLLGRAFCCKAPTPTDAFTWRQGVGDGCGHSGAGRKVPFLLPCTSPVYRTLQIPQKGNLRRCPALLTSPPLTGLAMPCLFGKQLHQKQRSSFLAADTYKSYEEKYVGFLETSR